VELALEISSHAYVLQTGRTVLDGPAQALVENPEVSGFISAWGDGQ
jgi:ABC-type branched-subunit amino acid transport system ATPase component